MSLGLALQTAISGLNVNQQALAVLAQNIANANTAGYSRQVVSQSAYYLDGQGAGVKIDDISRKVDTYLQRSIQSQTATVGQKNVVSDYMDRIQAQLGKPGDTNSLDQFVTNFFNSLQSLAETPDDASFTNDAVNAGSVLATQLSTLSNGLQDLRYQADQDIHSSVDKVNGDLKTLFSLNVAIERAHALGSTTAGLEDQRDAALKDISNNMDIQTYFKASGAVNVFTANGASLLDDNLYQLSYTPAPSADTFINEGKLKPLQIIQQDSLGQPVGKPIDLVTSGTDGSDIHSSLKNGTLKGLVDLRDNILPGMLEQLDTLAAGVRDQVNAVHNDGSGFPPASQLTGTRLVVASDEHQWAGSVQIGVLDKNGQPVPSPYNDEPNGVPPLTLDLSSLNSGLGTGISTVQTVIDEINNYYGTPQNKAEVGNMNNIQLAALSDKLPGAPPQFSFDFNLSNISGKPANFWVTGMQVLDDTNTDITNTSNTLPSVALDPLNTYTTTANSTTVTVKTTGISTLKDGDVVYLSDPGAAVNGIPNAEINGYYKIKNVGTNSFEIETVTAATSSGTVGVVGQTALPPYSEVDGGGQQRTGKDGDITLDLSANTLSTYYTVKVNVAVDDGSGNPSTAVIEYHLPNNNTKLLNDRYSAVTVTGNGTLVRPNTTQATAYARLVDANGHEIPKVNGKYIDEQGYLQIIGNADNTVAVNELDSQEQGLPQDNPPVDGTDRGFSFFFELNNFFQSNLPTPTGDTVKGSAYNMAVEQRLLDDPNLITTGKLSLGNQPTDPTALPNYTYTRNSGDDSTAQELAKLGLSSIDFGAAGGLPNITQTFNGYSGQILAYSGSQATAASSDLQNNQTLLDGYNQRSNAISGVNLDEELANTITYQNAYAASARVITVASDLFKTLLDSF